MDKMIFELERRAAEVRMDVLKMFSHGKAHHFGGSFSCVDILTALYFNKMNYSIDNWQDPGRDRFIMSKGHSVPVQYAILAQIGLYDQSELLTIKQLGSRFQGHPDIKKTPGIEAPTGSLGQGLSYANGMAIAARNDNLDFNIFVLLGDGELQEGQVWEATMTTAHKGLHNICVIVDRNCHQSQGSVSDLMCIEPLKEKFASFGWYAEVIDGHNMQDICSALGGVPKLDRPVAIIADTVKGKGISFIEGTHKYHNYSLTIEEYDRAYEELLKNLARFDRKG